MTLSFRRLLKISLFSLLIPLVHCSSTAPQVSGIVAITNFETIACQPQEKTMTIRNTNAEEPQRVQGVMFELGTNQFDAEGNPPNMDEDEQKRYERTFVPYFKILEVSANGKTKSVVGDLAEEIILPPGGSLTVKVAYNPKMVTSGEKRHKTYLDIVLNGPKLGTMQIELDGKAETALPNCGPNAGNLRTFEVISVKTILNDKDLSPNPAESDLNVATQVKGDFKFKIDGEKVVLPVEGWPEITLEPPDQAAVPVKLFEDSPEGTFAGGDLTIEGLTLAASGIPIGDVKISTGTVTVTAADADGGTFSLTGVNFDDTTGEMTLVVATPLTADAFSSFSIFNGAFGAVIKLKEKK